MRKLVLFAMSLLLLGAQAWAQRTVSGKVTSAEEPAGIPGVAVQIKGTTIGAITDFDGMYTIKNVPENATTLTFTFMGMKTKEMPIKGSVINVLMEPTSIALEAVTVTSYGVRKKVDNVGAGAQVGDEVIKKQTESNVINGLQGSVAGLQISSSTGQPGAPTTARIRGNSSINSGNAPLYVVDGVPINTGGFGMGYSAGVDPLSSINPEDIESISVLKDASATSIYGSRASNGVIVITTKKGKQGTSDFTVNAKVGVATPPIVMHNFTKIGLEDYRQFLLDSRLNSLREGYEWNPLINDFTADDYKAIWDEYGQSGVHFEDGHNTNWWKEVTRNALIQDYSLTASGGTETVNYYASVGYFNNKGIAIGSDFTRYAARINLDYKPTKWLTFGMNLNGSYAEVNSIPSGGLAYADPIWSSANMRPTDPVRNEDGSWYTQYNEGYNPVAMYGDEYPEQAFQQQYKAIFSPYLRVQFYKNVFFQTKVGVDFVTVKEKNVWSSTVNPQGRSLGGLTQQQDETSAILGITNTLNWMPSIKDHNFNIMVGQEAQKWDDFSSYASGYNYAHPSLTDIASAAETSGYSAKANATLASYFGNIEYDYASKYYLSASVRGDGSSRFGADHKWGTFFSVGGKYRISAENFMAGAQSWLNNLNIRVSYGTSGNQNIGYYAAQGNYASTRYAGIPGYYQSALENPNLSWESRNKFGAGIELSIFDALTIELDYYYDVTNDMIFSIPLSRATGFTGILSNIGKMRNQGVEVQLNALLVNKKNFKWTLAFNITTNDNKILKLATDDPIIGSITKLEEGLSSAQYFMQEFAGADPATGKPRWIGKDGEYVYSFNQAVKRELGSYNPLFYGGITTRFEFFNFDLSFQFNYTYGNKIFMNDLRYLENLGERGTSATTYYVYDNQWTTPGQITDVPQVVSGGNNGADNFCSRQLVDASYFKIKNIMLGYTLPRNLAQKIYLKSFRAFIGIDNLYAATSKDFRGYDPESGLGGTQAGNYPTPINYTIGINVGF